VIKISNIINIMTVIETIKREELGSSKSRAVRHKAYVPACIYGGSKAAVIKSKKRKNPHDPTVDTFSIELKPLLKLIQSTSFLSQVHRINVMGVEQTVIAKSVQKHPVTDMPLHIGFMRVDENSRIHVSIPVVFINEDKSPGIKLGGALNIIVHALEIICSPNSIPDKFEVSLLGAPMHHTISLGDIQLPKGSKAAYPDRDHVIATIVAPSGTTEETSSAVKTTPVASKASATSKATTTSKK
jgi:large subunit ribosomal protein L25